MGPEFFKSLIMVLVPMILCLTVHEYAHAWSAWKLGDDTAARMGRKTLNPFSHIDVFGTLLIPAMAVYYHMPFFGWAKPVPITPVLFTRKIRMKTGILLTAAAGPISNLIFALFLCFIMALILKLGSPSLKELLILRENNLGILPLTIRINIILALFNLIPVPPLDGSKVLWGILPDRSRVMETIERYSFILFIILILSGVLKYLWLPSDLIYRAFITLSSLIVGL
jgi:Zn-dependent protease